MTSLQRFFLGGLAILASLAAAKAPKPPSVDVLIDRAEAAVYGGNVDPARDLGPLLERLGTSKNASEQRHLIDAIEELGRYDSSSPSAVKAWLLENAPPVLLNVAKSNAEWLVRCNALMSLRALNVSDTVLDEAIAIANADTSKDQRPIRFRGTLLANWKESRTTVAPAAANPSPNEQAALELLRRRGTRVSPDSLGQAASDGDAEVVTALLNAGVDVNTSISYGQTVLDYAIGVGCFDNPDVEARMATLNVLLERGVDVKRKDGNDNTVLMFAVDCPVPVIEKLIAAGVDVNAVNAMKLSALHMAFAKGQWDVAEVLVNRGARLSQKEIDKLFFEKPTEPEKVALLKRAAGK